MGRPWPRVRPTPHASGADGDRLADTGVGVGLLEPLPRPPDRWKPQGDRSSCPDGQGDTRLVERPGAAENLLHSFALIPQCAADVDAADHCTSTHPDSPFTGQLAVTRRRDGELGRLPDREYSRSRRTVPRPG
ncbi:arylamine N-acetyltransferase [Streptomyces sp. KMM 9044]|uniref:arylamine N-acetyltransferase n=1 Tax=Streptomyces sp. KMM 9044 TaxID=2744474 RepID=UPI002151339E|nr:arylamine N-acetyltransferase [Streptomyces sp. KMM 9044]WAX77442.1 arylamine N-acetyltransferase [Streptomyces sp. KMM 9044]